MRAAGLRVVCALSMAGVCLGGGGDDVPSVFALEHYWDSVELAACASVVIGVTILVEFGLHFTRHSLRKHNPVMLGVLDKLVQEMFILGFISFLIFFFEQTLKLHKQDYYLELELAHMLIFFTGVTFVLQAVYFVLWVTRFQKHWDRITNMRAQEFANRFERMNVVISKLVYLPFTRDFLRRMATCEGARTKAIERVFRRAHHLPPAFDFTRYLSIGLQSSFVRLVDISPTSWTLAIGFWWCAVGLEKIFGADSPHDILVEIWMPIGFAFLAVFLVLFVLLRIARRRVVLFALDTERDDPNVARTASVAGALWHEKATFEKDIDLLRASVAQRSLAVGIGQPSNSDTSREFVKRGTRRVHVWLAMRALVPIPFGVLDVIMQFMLVMNAVYFSFFFCLTAWADSVSISEKIVIFLPALLNILFVIPFVLKDYHLLESLMYLDHRIFSEVVDQMHFLRVVKKTVMKFLQGQACSLLQGKKNEDVTEQEVLEALSAVFDKVAGGSSRLFPRDMHKMLMQLGMRDISRLQARRFFRIIDLDRNGYVEFDEFSRVLLSNLYAKSRGVELGDFTPSQALLQELEFGEGEGNGAEGDE